MKRFPKLFLSVFAIVFTLISCTKDSLVPGDPLVGNWILDNIVVMVPKTDPQTINVNGDCTNKNYYNLTSGGLFDKADVDPATCQLTVADGKWKKTNNTLEITLTSGDVLTFNIQSATVSKLVLRMLDLGGDAPVDSYADFNFTKKQ